MVIDLARVSYKSFLGRVLRFPLQLIPSGTALPIPQGPLRGKRWIIGSCPKSCWLGTYEYAKQVAFSAAIKRGDVVYDLGANAGYYSLLASMRVGPEGKVISFEPVPGNLAFLRKHLELNKVSNCTVWDVAVGSSNGTAKFDLGPSPLMGHLGGDSLGSLSVRTVTLDSLIASGQIPPPNVIKSDIEGGEYEALKGAAEIFSKYSPIIFLATHGPDVHERCCKLLTDLHYQLTSLDETPLNLTTEVLATPRPR